MAQIDNSLFERLKKKSQAELLALLTQLVQRQPDIQPLVELLIELPQPVTTAQEKRPGRGRERTLDPSTIQSQVALAFDHAGTGWDAAGRAAVELEKLCNIGQDFAEAGQWANAQVFYSTLAEETIAQYEGVHDEGQLSWVLGQCAAGLVVCLEVQSSLPQQEQLDAIARAELLSSLFDLWKFGERYGGIEEDITQAMAEHATVHEQKRVEAWLREEIRPGQDSSSQWRNRSLVGFLATLKQAQGKSQEEVLSEYRNVGLYKELAEQCLQFGRQAEALAVAQAHLTEPLDVTRFAEQLLNAGEHWRDQALAFVEKRLGEAEALVPEKLQDFTRARVIDTYRRWLSEKYPLYGRAERVLELEMARFQASPDEATYRSVRSAAQASGQPEYLWPDLRPQLLQTLKQQARWGALVTIALEEKEVGQALAALRALEGAPKTPNSRYSYPPPLLLSPYQVRVAKAAEELYPDEAIRLYKSVIQTLIAGRGRENYQQAADYASRIKLLSQKQGQHAAWETYIMALRNNNKSLRALKEELDKKGL